MHADAAMRPGHNEQDVLEDAEHRREHPEHQNDVDVVVVDAVEQLEHPRAERVLDEQERHGQAEQHLGILEGLQPERAALIERVENKREMGEERAIEQHDADPAAPEADEDVAAHIERVERAESKGEIEVSADIEEQHQSRSQPDPSQHRGPSRPSAR